MIAKGLTIALVIFTVIAGCNGKQTRKEEPEISEAQNKENLATNFINNPAFNGLTFVAEDAERKDILTFGSDGNSVTWELVSKYGTSNQWKGTYDVDKSNSIISFNFPTDFWYHTVSYNFYKDSLPWDSENVFITLKGNTNEEEGVQKSLNFYGPKNENGDNDITVLNK